jgi:hypothetical protein
LADIVFEIDTLSVLAAYALTDPTIIVAARSNATFTLFFIMLPFVLLSAAKPFELVLLTSRITPCRHQKGHFVKKSDTFTE